MLRTDFVWRLTGLSYRTAVIATKGHYIPPADYPTHCRRHTDYAIGESLTQRGSRVLEFGCGIGGNLIAISPRIREGVGLDVNKGYVRIARRLATRVGCDNVRFVAYDGQTLPELGKFDLVFSLFVFERLPKESVRRYLRWMAASLAETGSMVAGFLTIEAKGSPFTRRLGDAAYVYWERAEAEKAIRELGFHEINARPDGVAHLVTATLAPEQPRENR